MALILTGAWVLGATHAARAEATSRWFVAQMGSASCVPLDDVDLAAAPRLHFGSGSMHTPADYQSALQAMGITISQELDTMEGQIVYVGQAKGEKLFLPLFNDRRVCQRVMSARED